MRALGALLLLGLTRFRVSMASSPSNSPGTGFDVPLLMPLPLWVLLARLVETPELLRLPGPSEIHCHESHG